VRFAPKSDTVEIYEWKNDMKISGRINRRDFLSRAAAVTAVAAIGGSVRGAADSADPGRKLNIAGIGIGGMGSSNLKNMETENIIALCDVDDAYAAKTFERYPNARRYRDYRVLLEKEKELDGVLIATPDHTHAVIAIAAMKAGKHVYCQKPLTHTIAEARRLAKVARETGVVTQMGIQGHSSGDMRKICEWIGDGAIGAVREVHAWCSLTYYPWGHAGWSTTHASKPAESVAVPSSLDWDLWLGPAPERPYHPCYHPSRWRAWWDFGCGMMGDRGVHTLDAVYWALKLGQPESISATSTNLNDDTHPVASIVTYHFGAREGLPPVKVIWFEGLEPPRPDDLEDGRKLPAEGGVLFKGDQGTLMCGVYGDSPQIIPYSKMKAYQQPRPSIPRVQGSHEQDWLDAIKQGRKACADFSYSGPLTEFALLGNIAKRTQSKILWDGPGMKVTNDEKANDYVSKQYREGWGF
jgi:predicted dehydrogenase